DFTDLYTFQLILNSGARLYIDNTLVIDSWSDKITPATVSGNFAMVANQFYKIRLEFYYAATGTPELVLKWLSAHIPSATVIPNTALFLPSATSQIVYAGSSPYAFSKSGNVYLFDPSFVG
ncbi:PA14 domain-containing protein, partial [Streptomyces scabiei]|uniref:PA14 domain-containing protein n=1 Tax=Streptomyces scabiei TaxID=1930 RepID=UPI0038F75EFE